MASRICLTIWRFCRRPSANGNNPLLHLVDFLNLHPAFWPLYIFVARIADVSIGTMRTIFVVRGHRFIAAGLGFFEVIIWLTAVSGVLAGPLTPQRILAYGLGFASGNVVGIWLEQLLAVGQQRVILISQGRHHSVAFGLRLASYIVTEVPARGGQGDVAMCFVIVPRRQVAEVMRIARSIDPEVFTAVEDVRHTSLTRQIGPYPTTGWRAVVKKK